MIDIIGTSLQKTTETTYNNIVRVFGEPHFDESADGDKIQVEWELHTPYGVATIYDWKIGACYLGNEGIAPENNTDWHIGGNNRRSANWVTKQITPTQSITTN